jgi:hypothetical protein
MTREDSPQRTRRAQRKITRIGEGRKWFTTAEKGMGLGYAICKEIFTENFAYPVGYES